MCGIAGVARIDGGGLGPEASGLLAAIADELAHRGPDDRELVVDGPVGLAFTRLSLVDPATGGQPLVSDDGHLVLIANGEVYNHRELAAGLPGVRLRGGSDCEVLLHLYRQHGLQFLDQVRGMFGLILWDRQRGHLVLARDRFGIKPLYYHRNPERIILASEIKALFRDPATPRQLDWERTLTTPLLPAAPYLSAKPLTTWFEDVKSVAAGTIQRIDLRDGSTEVHQYWTFPGESAEVPATTDEFVTAYRELLYESVRECATADAELGLFLSGGIDSAAVAALAAQQHPGLHTFSVLSASTYRNEDAENAHHIAAKLGLPNHQVLFDDCRVPEPDEWKRLVWLLETPLCGPEVYYKHELHRYAKQARPELRGMLLGAASDEFNGGYSEDVSGGGGWSGFLNNLQGMARADALASRPDLSAWWLSDGPALVTDEVVRRFAGRTLTDPYPAYLAWEYSKLQQYNVWHEDRTAAGSGIEARVPFLDHRLVELVAAVPAGLRRDLLWNKRILREAVRGLLPDRSVERPKVPFFYGDGVKHTYRVFARMLEGDGGALIEEALAAPGAAEFLDGAALRGVLAGMTAQPDSPQLEIALRAVNVGLLAGMAAAPPAPISTRPVLSILRSVEVSGWETQRPQLESLVGLRPAMPGTLVPRLTDNVMLLAATDGDWFVSIDGSLEFTLEAQDTRMLPLLRAIDGTRSIADLTEQLGRTSDDMYADMLELLESNVITMQAAADPLP
ncbi:asparagine synthase (glutamine-hydrolyzing) [Actinoplanes sp. NEAU-A12]|uniref:asparagine synthase (glutamine-hydrolyzing) n=2 Tax=Actinoplanes sandaracinus TaxID=3045177 RepID=A0ABT6WRA9_9ACTN|nr:asparagine synthase (glutamine-hydrolyzing) [Actinoplanes sandaracinus]